MRNISEIGYSYINMIKATKNLSDKTILAYTSDIYDFENYLSNNSLDEQTFINYVQHLKQDRALKDSTIRRKLVLLRMYSKYLYEKGYIAKNFFLANTFRFKKEKCLPKTVPNHEISKILNYLGENISLCNSEVALKLSIRNLALIDLLISTGIRIGEAAKISIDDIFPQNRMILIHGKGRKQRLIYISCDETWTNLQNWIKVRDNKNVCTDKLFVNKYGKQISDHGIEYIYKTIILAAGITTHSTPHYLRHTFATNLHSNGADLRSVQEILGHSSISTTEIYTEVSSKQKKYVMDQYNFRNTIKMG